MSKLTLGSSQQISIDLNTVPATELDLSAIASSDNGQAWLSVGDMHGNALKFLNVLLATGIVCFKDTKQQAQWQQNPMTHPYMRFKAIYEINEPDTEDLEELNTIINSLICLPNNNLGLSLLGDLLADRGNNDYFTLKILYKLSELKIPIRILLSNHDLWFIETYEKFKQNGSLYFDGHAFSHNKNYYKSLDGLKKHYEKLSTLGLTRELKIELDTLYSNYISYIQLLAVDFNTNNEPVIFSHAIIDPLTINKLAEENNVHPLPYSTTGQCNNDSLKQTIFRANEKVEKLLADGAQGNPGLAAQITNQQQELVYSKGLTPSQIKVYIRCLWSRQPDNSMQVNNFLNIHGHDNLYRSSDQSHLSLDCSVGKNRYLYKGELKIFCSNSEIAAQIKTSDEQQTLSRTVIPATRKTHQGKSQAANIPDATPDQIEFLIDIQSLIPTVKSIMTRANNKRFNKKLFFTTSMEAREAAKYLITIIPNEFHVPQIDSTHPYEDKHGSICLVVSNKGLEILKHISVAMKLSGTLSEQAIENTEQQSFTNIKPIQNAEQHPGKHHTQNKVETEQNKEQKNSETENTTSLQSDLDDKSDNSFLKNLFSKDESKVVTDAKTEIMSISNELAKSPLRWQDRSPRRKSFNNDNDFQIALRDYLRELLREQYLAVRDEIYKIRALIPATVKVKMPSAEDTFSSLVKTHKTIWEQSEQFKPGAYELPPDEKDNNDNNGDEPTRESATIPQIPECYIYKMQGLRNVVPKVKSIGDIENETNFDKKLYFESFNDAQESFDNIAKICPDEVSKPLDAVLDDFSDSNGNFCVLISEHGYLEVMRIGEPEGENIKRERMRKAQRRASIKGEKLQSAKDETQAYQLHKDKKPDDSKNDDNDQDEEDGNWSLF